MCIQFKYIIKERRKKVQLDYSDIGMRIKAERFRQNMSQERLAEFAELSIAHTSHIETGNTKVSLPALVRIANALGTTLDALVCDSIVMARDAFENEITREVMDCNEYEISIIADTIKALKASLRKRNSAYDL
jgi:transcriptional regulator with XRE-family HTH domain